MKRESNLIDILRFLGCFSVVWFHSSYFGILLPEQQTIVSNYKLGMITWAMPFFYVVSARFATKSFSKETTVRNLLAKVLPVVLSLMIYIIIYDLPNYILYEGYFRNPLHLFVRGRDIVSILKDLFYTILTGNYSPCYFLLHLIVIYIVSFIYVKISSINMLFRNIVILFNIYLLLFITTRDITSLNPLINTYVLNKISIGCASIGCIYELMNCRKGIMKLSTINIYQVIISIVFPIMLYGIVYLKFEGLFRNQFKEAMTIHLSIIFLILGDMFDNLEGKIYDKISYWGQKYSLGVFLLHALILSFMSILIPKIFTTIGIVKPSIFIFIIINVMSFVLAIGVTHILSKTKMEFLVNYSILQDKIKGYYNIKLCKSIS